MEAASKNLDYERAAIYRDRIHALTQIQSKQDINVKGVSDADVIALHTEKGFSCVQVFFFRGEETLGIGLISRATTYWTIKSLF